MALWQAGQAQPGERLERQAVLGLSPRGVLVGAALAAGVGALAWGNPAPLLAADPELAFVLRGMALLKAGFVVAALAAVWWRLGFEDQAPSGFALAYGAAVVAQVFASLLVWELSHLALASLLFHTGLFTLFLTALRDKAIASRLSLGKRR